MLEINIAGYTIGDEIINTYLIPSLIFIGLSIVLRAVLSIIINIIKFLTRKTKNTLDDELIKNLNGTLNLLAIVIAGHITVIYFNPSAVFYGYDIGTIFTALYMVIGVFAFEKIFYTVLDWYGKNLAAKTETKLDDELIPLLNTLGRIIIYVVGFLLVLSQLGIDVTALLAAFGVAGLAVALALQDPLANFFAGIYLMIDRPIKIGNYIRIGNEYEGEVLEIGWRTTKLLSPGNNISVIPNVKVAQSPLVNFSVPGPETYASVIVGVSYDEKPEKVIKVLKKAAQKAQEAEGADKNRNVIVRFDSFGDSAINYKVLIPIEEYRKRFSVADVLGREIYLALTKAKMEIPYPKTDIYIKEFKK